VKIYEGIVHDIKKNIKDGVTYYQLMSHNEAGYPEFFGIRDNLVEKVDIGEEIKFKFAQKPLITKTGRPFLAQWVIEIIE